MNPLFSGSVANPFMQNVMQMVKMARNGGNPQAYVNQLMQQNPQAAAQIQQIMQSGKNPKEVAMQMMKKNGIDPAQMMSMLSGM